MSTNLEHLLNSLYISLYFWGLFKIKLYKIRTIYQGQDLDMQEKDLVSKTSRRTVITEHSYRWHLFVIKVQTCTVNCVTVIQVSDEGQQAMRAYFNWFYWCVNIGSLIAFGVFGYVQQERSYFYGYIAPNVILVVAVIVFLSGVFDWLLIIIP